MQVTTGSCRHRPWGGTALPSLRFPNMVNRGVIRLESKGVLSNTPHGNRSSAAAIAEFIDPRLSHVNALLDMHPGHLALVRWFAGLIGERSAERIFGLEDEQFGAAYHYVEDTIGRRRLDEFSKDASELDVALYCSRLRWAVDHLEGYFASSQFPPNPIGGTADHWRIALIKEATKKFKRAEG